MKMPYKEIKELAFLSKEVIRLFVLTSFGVLLSLLFILVAIFEDDRSDNDWVAISDFIIAFGIGLAIGAYTLRYSLRTIRNHAMGLPRVDELSDRIKQKSATGAFFICLYLFLMLMVLSDDRTAKLSDVMCFQILGMLLIYGLFRLWYSYRGDPAEDGESHRGEPIVGTESHRDEPTEDGRVHRDDTIVGAESHRDDPTEDTESSPGDPTNDGGE